MRSNFIGFCHADTIDNIIALFGCCVGCNFTQFIVIDHATSAPLHLCVKGVGANVFHEENYFKRFDISTGCNQSDGNSDTEIFFCPQVTNQSVGVLCGISDLLDEVLRNFAVFKLFCENFFCNLNDIGCVVFILRKDQGFWNILPLLFAFGIEIFINSFLILRQNRPDLVGVDNRPVKRIRIVINSVRRFVYGLFSGLSRSFHNTRSGFDCAAVFRFLRFDPINSGRNIYTVDHRFIIGILFNFIVIKERVCFRSGRGSQTQNMCAREIVQHRFPFSVN